MFLAEAIFISGLCNPCDYNQQCKYADDLSPLNAASIELNVESTKY